MNALEGRIRAEIAATGPMRLDRFWNLAMYDAAGGYYARRDPFGSQGDFTTAPEVSQMFGELVGAWAVEAWRALGRPSPFVLAEIGPGRGTLMADVLRTVRRLDAAFAGAMRVRLVERSDRLAAIQIERLAGFDLPAVRRRDLAELEPLPTLIVANELLDAVAIRQARLGPDGLWRERMVAAVGGDGPLALADGPAPLPRPALPPGLATPEAGTVFEVSPERDAIAAAIGGRLARFGGAALLFDYGHLRPGFGDTLQALRRHRFADALADPGEADLTSHVDFARAAGAMRAAGAAETASLTQGEFLLTLGLRERAGSLGAGRGEAEQARIAGEARRLAGTGDGEMGKLFKVLAAASRPIGLPFLRAAAR